MIEAVITETASAVRAFVYDQIRFAALSAWRRSVKADTGIIRFAAVMASICCGHIFDEALCDAPRRERRRRGALNNQGDGAVIFLIRRHSTVGV